MEAPLALALALLAIALIIALVWLVYAVDALYKPYGNPSLDCAVGRAWNSSSYCAYYNGTVYYYVVAARP
ncbi:MAG: hypothetical protein ACP5I3_11390 [Thermoproteus sp.]